MSFDHTSFDLVRFSFFNRCFGGPGPDSFFLLPGKWSDVVHQSLQGFFFIFLLTPEGIGTKRKYAIFTDPFIRGFQDFFPEFFREG